MTWFSGCTISVNIVNSMCYIFIKLAESLGYLEPFGSSGLIGSSGFPGFSGFTTTVPCLNVT